MRNEENQTFILWKQDICGFESNIWILFKVKKEINIEMHWNANHLIVCEIHLHFIGFFISLYKSNKDFLKFEKNWNKIKKYFINWFVVKHLLSFKITIN